MLSLDDAAEADRVFGRLAEKGAVQMTIQETSIEAFRHARGPVRHALGDQLREGGVTFFFGRAVDHSELASMTASPCITTWH